MRWFVLLLLISAPVLAQSRKKKPVFDTEDVPAREAERKTSTDPNPLRVTIERLGGWPSDRSRRAAEILIVQKEKSLKPVLGVLISQHRSDVRLKPGAAYVLGRIGDKSNATTLILVAAESDQHRYAQVYLEAAHNLDPERAVKEAFRFFHLRATTLRHQATKFVRAHIHKENLSQVIELLDRKHAPLSVTREIGLQMLDRMYQLGEVDWATISEHIYKSLGDTSPQVAKRAMLLCAARRDERDNENVKALNRLITRDVSYWRERSYATLALAIHSSAYRVQPFTEEALEALQGARGLQHPKELLAQGSAAYGLAQVALRTSDPKLVKLLDRAIPIVLIEAVGAGNRHYKDFSTVMPLAYTMLRRITGKNFPDHAPIWSQWWRDHGHRRPCSTCGPPAAARRTASASPSSAMCGRPTATARPSPSRFAKCARRSRCCATSSSSTRRRRISGRSPMTPRSSCCAWETWSARSRWEAWAEALVRAIGSLRT